jgi:putative hydrolase of the HAD superfamily
MGVSPCRAQATLIFDGDDTLWRTMPLYRTAKRRFFSFMEEQGFDHARVEREFEARDIQNVARWGFTVERFRRSMVETYHEFVREHGQLPALRIEQRVSLIATGVVRNGTRPMPRSREVLAALRGRCRLALLTKGEYALQERRVAESAFRDFFERVTIVEHKDRATFLRLAEELKADARRTWSVGDSLRSDIRPALEAGLNAIWIPQDTWGYESVVPEHHERLLQISSIRLLPAALKKAGAFA